MGRTRGEGRGVGGAREMERKRERITSCFSVVVFEKNPEEGLEAIKRLLLQLPKVNFDVLKYIW